MKATVEEVNRVVEKEITLVLSEHEANVLLALTSKVGGAMLGPRGVISALSDSLSGALGYGYQTARSRIPGYQEGEIWFHYTYAPDDREGDEDDEHPSEAGDLF